MQIANNTFLVTGGSSGLGAACARLLADAGGRVVIADLNQHAGAALAAGLGAARFVATDVTDEAAVQNAVQTAVREFGGLHGAVGCAGIGLAERILGKNGPHDLAAFTRVIRVNLIGTFNVLRLAAAAMSQNAPTAGGERGVIVNTASIAAFEGQIGQLPYAAAKGGVVGMTLVAARDLSPLGIRVVTIAPGTFLTPAYGKAGDQLEAYWGPQVPHPKRMGRSPEYAALVQSICENDYLNGEVIRLDGALRFPPK